MSAEEKFMQRAIDLAKRGIGNVSPNPMVGAVLVFENKIVSEGWHENYGDPHAEVNAIKGVNDDILQQSQLYVSLEPCSHYGKTPPCADLIIEKKIPEVYIGCMDPNPEVAGKGIDKLKKVGIQVKTDILKEKCEKLNKRFFTRIKKNRPYIILKWAESADGFIAGENGKQIQISNEISQIHSHKMRALEDAILVGTNTVLNDNPSLTCRHWQGKNPLRISMDFNGRLHKGLNLFNTEAPTLIFNSQKSQELDVAEMHNFVQIENDLESIMKYLSKLPINSLIVEGGNRLLNSFLEKEIYDEIHIFKSSKKLGSGIKSPDFWRNYDLKAKILKDNRYYFLEIN